MPFDREQIKQKVAALATKGVFIGTSSWKYEGWLGQVYTPARYAKRKKVADEPPDEGWFPQLEIETPPKKPEKVDGNLFKAECLGEYAQVFKTVCVDGAYYKFPSREYLRSLAAEVPGDFQFAFKVTHAITIKRFPNVRESGIRAGKLNENFLKAKLFASAFLKPCEEIRQNVGILMFEFSRFHPGEYPRVAEFVADLERFFDALPQGWPYGVELRNRDWLQPEYFDCLRQRGITHVFNSWEAMPPVKEQMARPGSRTNPDLVAARFLLKPGRNYQAAVDLFKPYDRVKEPDPEARAAGAALIAEGKTAGPERKTFIYVNNRLEGNALETIDAMLETLNLPRPRRRM